MRRKKEPQRRNTALLNVTECTGLTPLAYAASCNAPTDIIRAILDADPESSTKTDDFSSTAIHLACLNGTTVETVKMILELGNWKLTHGLNGKYYSLFDAFLNPL